MHTLCPYTVYDLLMELYIPFCIYYLSYLVFEFTISNFAGGSLPYISYVAGSLGLKL